MYFHLCYNIGIIFASSLNKILETPMLGYNHTFLLQFLEYLQYTLQDVKMFASGDKRNMCIAGDICVCGEAVR